MPTSSSEQDGFSTGFAENDGFRHILIGVDATKDLSSFCFSWALKNVARPGDSIIVLGILHRILTPMGYMAKADLSAFHGPNKKALEAEIISKMELFEKVLKPLSDLCDKLQVHLDITITAGTPMKAVFAKEALKISPTHVVLDRNLRKDKLFYKEQLYCHLIVFSQSNQVEHLYGSNTQLTPKVTLAPGAKKSSFYPQERLMPLVPDRVEDSKGGFLSGRSSEADQETPMSSPGSKLCRSTSSSSKSSENFFIDLRLLDSPEGVVPVWSFDDTVQNSHATAQPTSYSADIEKALLVSPSETGHMTSLVDTSNKLYDPVDKFLDSQRQLPLLKELFESSEDKLPQKLHTVEERPADLHKSQKQLLAKTDKYTSESIVSDLDKKHDSRPTSLHLDRGKHSVRGSLLGKRLTQPPPLCSVCKLQALHCGMSLIIYQADEIKAATNNFATANLIAEGGFGFVYKGFLQEQLVAIKKLKPSNLEGNAQFTAEVEALSYAQHMNLVRLVGLCLDANENALVYEYVCNGSLDQHLSARNSCNLEWPSRFKVALGAARGLRYLHEECRVGCIVHRDVRPSNILVTHDYTAMVGDFGLAKISSPVEAQDRTQLICTLGYAAPEYIASKKATSKTDVFSYGVVLLELITGLRAMDLLRPKGQVLLTDWARSRLDNNQVDNLLDQNIAHSVDKRELDRMVKAATLCITKDPKNRPGMSQIIRILEGDFDNAEASILRMNYTSKPSLDDQNTKREEGMEEMDKLKLHQINVRTFPPGNSVNRNWRSWVKSK